MDLQPMQKKMGLGCKLSVDLHLMCKKGWVQLQVELEFATKTKINQARNQSGN